MKEVPMCCIVSTAVTACKSESAAYFSADHMS